MFQCIFLFIFLAFCSFDEMHGNIPTTKLLLTQQRRFKPLRELFFKKMAHDYPQYIITKGPVDQKKIALTFDDGPDAKEIPKILDVLKHYQVKATFFFIGERIEANKMVVVRTHQEGHLVLNHSWSHPRFSTLTSDNIKDEVFKTEAALNALIGLRPLLIRLPYGDFSNNTFHTLKSLDYKMIFWSIDSTTESKDVMIKKTLNAAAPGEIILMHSGLKLESGYNTSAVTSEALPFIIETLIKEGYNFVTINDFC